MPRKHTITIYQSKDGPRWRMRAPNGRITGEGGEGYSRPAGVRKGLDSVIKAIQSGDFVIVDETKKP